MPVKPDWRETPPIHGPSQDQVDPFEHPSLVMRDRECRGGPASRTATVAGPAAQSQPPVQPFFLRDLENRLDAPDAHVAARSTGDLELHVSIELGRAEICPNDVLKLRAGSVVPLERLIGEGVDVLLDGRLVARGEVLVLHERFCVRISELVTDGK